MKPLWEFEAESLAVLSNHNNPPKSKKLFGKVVAVGTRQDWSIRLTRESHMT